MSNDFSRNTFIRDAIHKNIDISEPVIKDLVATKEFQRLRWISQLAGAQISFPSACHSRFSHSLGVYHILNRVFSQVSGTNSLQSNDKLVVKIAGLLHDIGHGPFSHTFEKVSNYQNLENFQFSHEWYTCAIIENENTEINQVLKKYNIAVDEVVAIIKKDITKVKKYQIQLVSSQLDCDRIDYLMRDGYFTGVKYGSIDLDWVISNMIINEEKGVSFSYKAISAIENYLITRFHMYSQVYYHKNSIFFDLNLQKLFNYIAYLKTIDYEFSAHYDIFENIFNNKSIAIKDYLKLNDATILNLINDIIEIESETKLISLAKSVLAFNQNTKVKMVVVDKQQQQNKQNVIVLKNVIYNLKKEPIIIQINENEYLPLEKVSQILKSPLDEQLIIYE